MDPDDRFIMELQCSKEDILRPDIVEINRQFSYLHDEITSVKKSAVLHGEITESQFDTIKDTTASIKVTIENDAKKVQQRFKAIHDTLKNIHDNVKLSKLKSIPNGKGTTETIQEEKNNQPNPVQIVPGNANNTDVLDTRNDAQQDSLRQYKTLLIGSSILKGIRTRGLNPEVEISTNPGADFKRILEKKLRKINLNSYANVIVYIGGNDISNGRSVLEVSKTIEQIVLACKQHNCKVYLCMICHRKDGDVIPVNDCIKQMSELYGVNYMNIYGAFTFNDGSVATHFYYRDGIYLNNTGTSTLVRSINNVVPIIKKSTNQQQDINQT